jgi:hypothetical protein
MNHRLLSPLLVACLVASGCSSGDDSATVESTTTTVEVVEADDGDGVATTTSTVATLDGPIAPLTGMAGEGDLDRPALAAKIDNHPNARPQTALDQADLVFEARAEGVTRFLAVFHSESPSPFGPVRSSRTSDFDLLRGLDTPLYSSSGGNDYVANGLRSLPIIEVTAISQSSYFRDGSRPAPHNLFVNADDLFALAGDDAIAPSPWFDYRTAGEALNDSAAMTEGSVTIRYRGSPVVTHTWSSARAGWLRTQDGRPHTTVTGDQLAPENVVVLVTSYVTSAADSASPELVSVGSGQAFVLTDGAVIEGTWNRPTASDKPELIDLDGQPIKLTPGRTWVLYPESGQVDIPGF